MMPIWIALLALATARGSTDEERIREARARSNDAIREHDADGVASSWAESYSLVASTNLQLSGREENRDSLAQHFQERPDVVYVRAPNEIGVFEPWGMAHEIGTWEGSWTEAAGRVEIGGTYFAKWQKTEDGWKILAEIFVPTHCAGTGYCQSRP